jgi:hypothetical protein
VILNDVSGDEILAAIQHGKDLVADAIYQDQPLVMVNTRYLSILVASAALWAAKR